MNGHMFHAMLRRYSTSTVCSNGTDFFFFFFFLNSYFSKFPFVRFNAKKAQLGLNDFTPAKIVSFFILFFSPQPWLRASWYTVSRHQGRGSELHHTWFVSERAWCSAHEFESGVFVSLSSVVAFQSFMNPGLSRAERQSADTDSMWLLPSFKATIGSLPRLTQLTSTEQRHYNPDIKGPAHASPKPFR